MSSKLYVDSIEPKTTGGNISITNANLVTPQPVPSGLTQAVMGKKETSANTTSTSYVTTGLEVTITPAATNSKILINCSWNTGFNNNDHATIYTLYRDSTNLSTATTESFGSYSFSGGDSNSTINYATRTASLLYLDEPNTTSAVTYKLMFKTSNASYNARFNYNVQGEAAAQRTCTIVAQEIRV